MGESLSTPFIRIQGIDQLVMNKVFKAQRDYLNNTTSTLVPGINPTINTVVMKNGETTTLHKIMKSSVVDRQILVISAVNKDSELYLLHSKQHQEEVNKLVQNVQHGLSELLGEEDTKQLFNEDPGKEHPVWRMIIHNALLKSYADSLVARYGNPQDDGETRNMVNLQDGDGLTDDNRTNGKLWGLGKRRAWEVFRKGQPSD